MAAGRAGRAEVAGTIGAAQPAALRAPGPARIRSIDATRGLAMLCVCYSHFLDAALRGKWGFELLHALGMIASPAFMLISGMTLGYTSRRGRAALERFVGKLRERAVFLLTVVHLLLIPANSLLEGGLGRAARSLFITDTIGIALLVGPWVVARTRARARLLVAAGLMAATWVVILSSRSTASLPLGLAQELLFGTRADHWLSYSFPIVPWIGVYLFGTVVGESLPEPARGADGAVASAKHALLRWARWLLAGAVVAILIRLALHYVWPAAHSAAVHMMLTPFGKRPPSPNYVLTYGAIALALAALLTHVMEHGRMTWLTARLEELGRASVWVFVVQFYVYYVLLVLWPMRFPAYWPLYFLGSLLVISAAARVWLALGGNRLIRIPGWPTPATADRAGGSQGQGGVVPPSGTASARE